MARIGNIIFGVLNGLSMITGLIIIGWVAYLHVEWSTECYKLVQTPLFIIGIVMFSMSLLGLIGACFRANICLWIYIIFTIVWVLVLLFSAGHVFLITRPSPEQSHQNWVKQGVSNGKHWAAVKTCLIDADVCQGIVSKAKNLQEFQLEKTRDPIQDACCRPPEYCGFEFKNATFWTAPKGGVIKRDGNCMAWNNRPDILCFNCDQCEETIIAELRTDAGYLAIGLSCELVLIVIICILGCCVRINNNNKS